MLDECGTECGLLQRCRVPRSHSTPSVCPLLVLPLQKLKVSRKQRSHVGRARREMKKHEPKLVENTKTLLALKGLACSSIVTDMLKDLVCARMRHTTLAPSPSPLPLLPLRPPTHCVCARVDL